jgi:hypothetical protein
LWPTVLRRGRHDALRDGVDGLDWLTKRNLEGMVITNDDEMHATAGYLHHRVTLAGG